MVELETTYMKGGRKGKTIEVKLEITKFMSKSVEPIIFSKLIQKHRAFEPKESKLIHGVSRM